ncbi:MAG TPA: 2Fe-2S iron-sulfur cluster-binding protein [Polyangiaceae bacterium]|nr:2Fe-2S iron-sulfur cluster-binding protein [Polyangiaceae bacterium]
MPTFKLDDREIPFEPGDTIIRAAHRVGIDIPHYCWHPGLSVAANCRMCLVEVLPPPGRPAMMLDVVAWDSDKQQYISQKKPKLQPACQMAAGDGMVVKSQTSEHVIRARSAVQELLLLNHPVDCPICDQAGECRLQDYWLEHQASKKRMRDEPVHKPKGVVFGPTIVYDAERCIVCTRCVRVSEELAKDPVLSVRERGNLNEIVVAPGRQLDHNYTLMTEHVCPVGALTAVDFRFKARVWFLRSARSVCVGCATGCNSYTDYDPRSESVLRYRPRENLAVNKYWMCDEGMLDYRRIHKGRVLAARVQGEPTTREAALEKAAELLRVKDTSKVAVVLSAEHSQEDNLAMVWLARDVLGTSRVFVTGKPPGKADNVLMHADKNPNTAGVQALAQLVPVQSFADFEAALRNNSVEAALVLGSAVPQGGALSARKLVALSSHEGKVAEKANVVLPVSSWAEADGTFVNHQNLAQVSEKVIRPQGDSRPAWRVVADLAKALGRAPTWRRPEELRDALLGALTPGGAPSAGASGANSAGSSSAGSSSAGANG